MKQYQVNITAKALADMSSIYEYIAVHLQSPETAMAQYLRIADGIESLREFPERCKTFDSQPERRLGLRQLRVNNYSAIFVLEDDRVTVIRVLYSASDISNRLNEA